MWQQSGSRKKLATFIPVCSSIHVFLWTAGPFWKAGPRCVRLYANCIMLYLAAELLQYDPKSILWKDYFCACEDLVYLRCRVTAKSKDFPQSIWDSLTPSYILMYVFVCPRHSLTEAANWKNCTVIKYPTLHVSRVSFFWLWSVAVRSFDGVQSQTWTFSSKFDDTDKILTNTIFN